jgi:hypothetical protein
MMGVNETIFSDFNDHRQCPIGLNQNFNFSGAGGAALERNLV